MAILTLLFAALKAWVTGGNIPPVTADEVHEAIDTVFSPTKNKAPEMDTNTAAVETATTAAPKINNYMGQVVKYVTNGAEPEAPNSAQLPATVTSINPDGTLNLSILLENTQIPVLFRRNVPNIADAGKGTGWDYLGNAQTQNSTAFSSPKTNSKMNTSTKMNLQQPGFALKENAIVTGTVTDVRTDAAKGTVENDLSDSTGNVIGVYSDSEIFASTDDLCAALVAEFNASQAPAAPAAADTTTATA